MVGITGNLVFWALVCFGLLVLLLSKFGFGPLVEILEARERKIRESIEQAEHARLEAERMLKEYEDQLAEARNEAHKMIAESKELGEKLRAEIVQKSEEESKRIIAKAEEQINREVEQAIKELRSEIGNISIDLAAKVIEKELDGKAHEKLIDKYMSEVGSLS